MKQTQSDIFARPKKVTKEPITEEIKIEKPKPLIQKIQEQNKSFQQSSLGYLPISIDCTNGQLKTPKVLHFRNFNLDEVIELNSFIDNSLKVKSLIKILTNMNSENFDCSELHAEELKEIMIKLYANYQSPIMDNMLYLIDDTKDAVKSNIGRTKIDLTKLSTDKLRLTVKDNIIIGMNDIEAFFEYPKMKHVFLTEDYINEYYEEEIEHYTEIEKKLKEYKSLEDKITSLKDRLKDVQAELKKEEITTDELKKESFTMQLDILQGQIKESESILSEYDTLLEDSGYEEFQNKKTLHYAVVYQKLLLNKFDGKELSLEERLDIQIDHNYYKALNEEVKKNKFGVSNKYSFRCKHNQKKITRSFPFRTLEFLPTLQLEHVPQYSIRYD